VVPFPFERAPATEEPTVSEEHESSRAIKARVLELLEADDFTAALEQLGRLSAKRVINALFSFFLHAEERVRWRAVVAMGATVSSLADMDMEAARVVMRRLMWSLNDESGGIGWGAPEAMGEILARNERLSEEYATILVSYLNPDGNFIEHEPLQRGLMWGLARLAEQRPLAVRPAAEFLGPYLGSPDATVRGLAAVAAGLLGAKELRAVIEDLVRDGTVLRRYQMDHLTECTVGALAAGSLEILRRDFH
jgi:HEAT repeat protein